MSMAPVVRQSGVELADELAEPAMDDVRYLARTYERPALVENDREAAAA